MSNIAEILKTWAEYFHVEGIPQTALRSLGWGIIKGLSALSAALEGIATSIYNLLPTIIEESGYQELLADFKPLLTVILGISIVFLGYLFIFKRPESIDGQQIFSNFLMIFLTITVMPLVSSQVADFTATSADEIFNTFEKDGIAVYQVVDNNLVDMRLLLENGKLTSSQQQRDQTLKDMASCNSISAGKEALSYVQINEVLDYDNDDYSSDQEELISQKISVNTNGILTTVKMNRGFFDIGHEYYYRYHVNWCSLILTLGIVAATYLLAALKLSMIIWEVLLDAIIAPFIAVTDIASGQRIKEFLKNIMSLLALICIISMLLGGYGLGLKVLSGLEAGGDLGSGISSKAIYLLLLAALSWVVIFGPNIIERIFGVDAGLQNSYGVYRLMKDVAQAPGRIAKKAAHTAKSGAKILSGGGQKGDFDEAGSVKAAGRKLRSDKETATGISTEAVSTGTVGTIKAETHDKDRTVTQSSQGLQGKDKTTPASDMSDKAMPRIRNAETGRNLTTEGSSAKAIQNVRPARTGSKTGSAVSSASDGSARQRSSTSSRASSEVNGRYTGRISTNANHSSNSRTESSRISTERGIRSLSVQRSGAESGANIRSPHINSAEGTADAVLNYAQPKRYSGEVKNMRGGANLNTGNLSRPGIEKIQTSSAESAESRNRIIRNIKTQESNKPPVVNPDAQNFGRRKPKRK